MNSWQKWQDDLIEREVFATESDTGKMAWWQFGALIAYVAVVVGYCCWVIFG